MFAVSLALLIPLTAYAGDLTSDLLAAVEQGQTGTVKTLIDKGADVNAKTKGGWTALMVAAAGGYADTMKDQTAIVQLLKQAGSKE
jgi:ankyrin repeat protein